MKSGPASSLRASLGLQTVDGDCEGRADLAKASAREATDPICEQCQEDGFDRVQIDDAEPRNCVLARFEHDF